MSMSWEMEYKKRLKTADEALGCVKSGMRGARLEGQQIGRALLDIDREQVVQDRRSGMSLTEVAKNNNISRASVCRMMKETNETPVPGVLNPPVELAQQAGAGQ